MYTPPQRPPLFTETSTGMSLRDYFAAQAMPLAMQMLKDNYIKNLGDQWQWEKKDIGVLTQWSYEIADAMLDKAQKP
jgi:hypothetical protein